MFNLEAQEAVAKLKTNIKDGLSSSEAAERLRKYGANELEGKKKTSLIAKFLLQFKDVLIIILLIAAAVSIIVDVHEWADSLVILIVVILNAVLGVVQESKAEKALDALKKLSAPTCKAVRDGVIGVIPSQSLVPGDVIHIEAGDFIPADARIVEAVNLKIDESSLTGESVPVNKNAAVVANKDAAIGDKKNILFSSTFATYGRAVAVVYETGMNTEIGHIAKMLDSEENKLTPLQHKLNQVGKAMGILSIAICAIVFILQWIVAKDVLAAFKLGVALAVAAIPEGLAAVVTVILSIGVSKMVKRNAIVKKLPAVETLGCTSVVCSDKTGTLTQNKMTVVEMYEEKKKISENRLRDKKSVLISYAAICCDAKIENVDGEIKRVGDPTETALVEANMDYGEYLVSSYPRVAEIPFDSERKMMTVVVKKPDGKLLSITKGAPDIVFRLSDATKEDEEANKDMATRALRVLAVAVKDIAEIPTDLTSLENNMKFVGLVGMIDPARPEVKTAIEEARKAGIRTVMITGDHVLTAKAIAEGLGIFHDGDIAIASNELQKMSDEELDEKLERIRVYARVAPEDKVRIVKAWRKKGHVVAMTGDGVNDSPALKSADIGCAMGITGTDVAKEAAAMILTDDNFATIIGAVQQGRGVYSDIRKCVNYLLSGNIGEVLTIFVVSLLDLITAINFGVPLLPIHLLWINLITDTLPAFAIGMEEADPELMNDKPRDKKESFFARGLGRDIILQGLFIGGITVASYFIGHQCYSEAIAQTMAFTTLGFIELFHAFNVRTRYSIFKKGNLLKNKYVVGAFILGAMLQLIVLYVPGINRVFKLIPLSIGCLAVSLALAFSVVILMEIVKFIRRRRAKSAKKS